NYADEVRGEIEIDQNDNIYIVSCTRSPDFPVSPTAIQATHGGGLDGCVIKFNSGLSEIIWSTYIGGSLTDALYSVAIDSSGHVLVAGGTNSTNMPTTAGVIHPNYNGGRTDGYIAHIRSDGESLLNATYYGSGHYDQVYFVELDKDNNVYVLGQTEAPGNTFIHNAVYNRPNSGQFITKFNPEMNTIIWSTAFGTGIGVPNISPTAFLVDLCHKIYLAGWGGAVNQWWYNNSGYTFGMDVTANAYQSSTDGSDFYLMVLEDDASALSYGSFFGGPISGEHVDGGTSRFDRKGKMYQAVCAGCGWNSDFPIHPNPGAVSSTNNHSCNSAVFKFDFEMPAVVADFIPPTPLCNLDLELNFQNRSLIQNATEFLWDFGDGTTSTEASPTHTYTSSGTYRVKLILSDNLTCNLADSMERIVHVRGDSLFLEDEIGICPDSTIRIGINPPHPERTYIWSPTEGLDNPTSSYPLAAPETNIQYTLSIHYDNCIDTLIQDIFIDGFTIESSVDQVVCHDSPPISMAVNVTGNGDRFYWSSDRNFNNILNTDISNNTFTTNSPEDTTVFYIRVLNPRGCEVIDSVRINLSDFELDAPNLVLCFSEEVLLNAFADKENLQYQWQDHESILSDTDTSTILIHPQTHTVYYVTAVDEHGCTRSDTASVRFSDIYNQIIDIAASEDTIWRSQSTQLFVYPMDDFLYTWTPSFSLNDSEIPDPIATPAETTLYSVYITDPDNQDCKIDTSITVVVKESICGPPMIFIPNAFTPNGDGNNDELYVRGENIDEFYFTVYNRWGEMVFETRDKNIGWDGTYKGRTVDPDVYVYYLKATCIGQAEYFHKGNVTLIR
ncbi:MAG: gliding motility-associated C-terminal domain-containing protein, partial [Cytophagaceae bacterium]